MSEYLAKEDVWVSQIELPSHVNAFCKCLNGENCAVINERLDDAAKRRAAEHEIVHFFRKDLDSDRPTKELEEKIEKWQLNDV